jgi:hypothetical protein
MSYGPFQKVGKTIEIWIGTDWVDIGIQPGEGGRGCLYSSTVSGGSPFSGDAIGVIVVIVDAVNWMVSQDLFSLFKCVTDNLREC